MSASAPGERAKGLRSVPTSGREATQSRKNLPNSRLLLLCTQDRGSSPRAVLRTEDRGFGLA